MSRNLPQVHFMVDLETLATVDTAAILTVGMCVFNPVLGEIGPKFYERCALGQRRAIDENTIMWWMRQNDAARNDTFANGEGDRLPMGSVFQNFIRFIENQCFSDDLDGDGNRIQIAQPVLWSNGPTFDENILRNAFAEFQWDFPFPYYASRCFRTVRQLAQDASMGKPKREGAHHNALDDAIFQAQGVIALYNEFGISATPVEELATDLGKAGEKG